MIIDNFGGRCLSRSCSHPSPSLITLAIFNSLLHLGSLRPPVCRILFLRLLDVIMSSLQLLGVLVLRVDILVHRHLRRLGLAFARLVLRLQPRW